MPPTISYTIAMPHPHTHLYEITLDVRGVAGPAVDVALPAWTPGSYMIREYARHVQEFTASTSSHPLSWNKLDKATWRVETGGATELQITYKVYANELTVRTSHLDGTHGYFNPATLCMYVVGRTSEPLDVHVVVPEGWRVTTGLEPTATPTHNDESDRRAPPEEGLPWSVVGGQWSFVAQDYDELVDAPFECGAHRLLTFDVDGIPHRIALWGSGNEDEARIVEDTRKIVETARDMFGGLPYQHYTFIVHLCDARGGGLEHRNSVSMLIDRWTFQPRKSYERYLGLTAHEFFHVWNVKRLRVAPLGPFDYSRENYTRQLWAMEGVTSYYTDLLLLRAGLISPARYFEALSDKIIALQGQPGRAIQSLEQSSFDAWIKFYRPDENTPNSAISYYLKGELVALLLDLEIRRRTNSARSLDDVLRYLYATYPIDGPGIPEDSSYRAAVEAVVTHAEVADVDGSFEAFFKHYIAGTEELDYTGALGAAGLLLDWGYKEGSVDGLPPVWLGARLKTEHGRVKVASVFTGGPAQSAGIYADDELIALDGFRASEEHIRARLAERSPGDTLTFSLFRRDELLHIPVALPAAPPDRLAIVQVEQPGEEQRRLYEAWIGSWDPTEPGTEN